MGKSENRLKTTRGGVSLAFLVVGIVTLFGLGPATASAAFIHPAKTDTFGPDGTAASGGFGDSSAADLAVDQTRDRLYVLRPRLYNQGNTPPPQIPRGIYAFDISGPTGHEALTEGFPITLSAPLFTPRLAVDETEGNIFYVDANGDPNPALGTLFAYDSTGSLLGNQFPLALTHKVTDIAVDDLGYLRVLQDTINQSGGEVEEKLRRYSPEGVELDWVDLSPLGLEGEEAIFDPTSGDIWLATRLPAQVVRLSAASGYTEVDRSFVAGDPVEQIREFAFDAKHGVIYLSQSTVVGGLYAAEEIRAYDEQGVLLETFAQIDKSFVYDGLAVDEDTGSVYLIDDSESTIQNRKEGAKIRVWGGVVVPDATTGEPLDVGHTTAIVQGRVGPAGGPGVEECEFEYGTNTTYSLGSIPCVPAASPGVPITTGTDVTAELTGLTPGIPYHYRLVAANENGEAAGLDEVVIPQPSLTSTGAATEVQRTAATLNGTIDPEGISTTFYFEYGKSKSYGSTSSVPPGVTVGTTEAGAKPVSAPIAGLDPGAIYHYRLVAVNSKGTSHGLDRVFTTATAVKALSTDPATDIERNDATLHGSLDPDGLATEFYFEWGRTKRYGQTSAVPPGDDLADISPGLQGLAHPIGGLETGTLYHYRLVASNPTYGTTYGEDRTFTTAVAVAGLETEPATGVGPTVATLNGRLDPDGFATTFYFQWGKTASYGHFTPLPPPGEAVGTISPGSLPMAAALGDLEPGTTYHFRLVAENSFGVTAGGDAEFTTPQAPSIEGVLSANVTATAADLVARINPNGFATTYRFEYGPTTAYGAIAPVPDGDLPASSSSQGVTVPVGGLSESTYHFRLVAESQWGTTTSEDQTFDFNPPNCPNSAVRQQTGAAYLPDCRAYELVSPARAGGAVLLALGPFSPSANDRFAFSGAINAIPGTGNPPNAGTLVPTPDLYVASRTPSGWTTRYVGIPADRVLVQGGPPPLAQAAVRGPGGVVTDEDMNRFLTWDNSLFSRSHAPYAWDNAGNELGRLPTNLAEIPDSTASIYDGGFLGESRISADFGHYVFSAIRTAFAPGGLTTAPGSVYDNDLDSGSVAIVSRTAAGGDLPQDAAAGDSSEYLRIPAVSADGSRILMSTKAATGAHLYLRENGSVTHEISLSSVDMQNHGVKFEGMSGDGSEIYFTTAAKMTADDQDTSTDLYRWSENGGAPIVTRLSKGDEGEGNSDGCNPEWGLKCGVEVVLTKVQTSQLGLEKPELVDSALATKSGDIYFYSPEELDGARGVPGRRNVYLWHDGEVRHVLTLGGGAGAGASRINVSPDGAHMAFVTTTRVGPYDNAGRPEMHRYDRATQRLVCVSCRPDGLPPTSDVAASQNGIFMADDGRAFFSTADALVPRDANGIIDVYEYVDGRPQLITTGTGDNPGETLRPIGLVGVSADGVNTFVSTYQTLVGQDENGDAFLKFYNARTGGGFPFSRPAAPCAAADECHGPDSSPPAPQRIGTGASLGASGNVVETVRKKRKRRAKKRRRGNGRRQADAPKRGSRANGRSARG